MKQQILNLKKKLLLVELPEGSTDVHINDLVYKNKVSFRTNTSLHFIETKENLLGEAPKLIGKLTDITEQQFAEWVPNSFNSLGNGIYEYADYCNNEICMLSTAKKSFLSYLEKEGIYFSNPLDWEKKAYFLKGSENSWGHDDLKRWQEAEQKVWKIENTYLFEIL